MTCTSIIIPTYNGLDLLQSCIASIRQYTGAHTPYEIVVVDNGSTDGTAAYCAKERLRFVRLPENRGFPAACNAGLRVAIGDELLLLNNDVTVTSCWLENLRTTLYSDEQVGITGPVTNYASGIQQVKVDFHSMEHFQELARENNVSDPEKWIEVKRIVGLCMLIRRRVLDSIGLLDEAYSPGHYEDDDYCYRARVKGFRLRVCGDVLVHHQGSASFLKTDPDTWKQLLERNRSIFINKWQVDPLEYIETSDEGGNVK
ncbi:glycosyltransferase family 2 protein [Paenibacillus sp. MER 99-2]|uniref:glycosyltransferase family 2 protein n=1 Tax=Paenibacillus sp. MER 99-2 TaxID=2939572 RepID=UPI00203FC428|nr:glycosyltransferase family 2 protein [Paenibacillus sp. MER 99-2]MCM3175095.1 glycosyltransferase family 2 protein [Paenibacillus sp. MER 99-2]